MNDFGKHFEDLRYEFRNQFLNLTLEIKHLNELLKENQRMAQDVYQRIYYTSSDGKIKSMNQQLYDNEGDLKEVVQAIEVNAQLSSSNSTVIREIKDDMQKHLAQLRDEQQKEINKMKVVRSWHGARLKIVIALALTLTGLLGVFGKAYIEQSFRVAFIREARRSGFTDNQIDKMLSKNEELNHDKPESVKMGETH